MPTDLSQFDAAKDNARMVVVHPGTGQPLEDEDGKKVTLILRSQDSEAYRSIAKSISNRRLNKQLGNLTKMKFNAEELERDALEVLVAATAGWENISFKGSVLEFTPENARMLYSELPWLREQVDAFVGERGNFLGN